jgi:hypothetical protein
MESESIKMDILWVVKPLKPMRENLQNIMDYITVGKIVKYSIY